MIAAESGFVVDCRCVGGSGRLRQAKLPCWTIRADSLAVPRSTVEMIVGHLLNCPLKEGTFA